VSKTRKSNGRLIAAMTLIVAGMFGFGFALVPLYDVFCELTGLNGKVKTEATAEAGFRVDEKREVTVEFVTSVNGNTPLAFRAEKAKLNVHPGQYYTVDFHARNLTGRKLVGQAIPSIAPGAATPFLKKAECFCFSEQAFEPGQERTLPVRFTVDPALPEGVVNLTLSYTFFDITDKQRN
jgi:cytochrome c oxidase assembly protein subunit 11